MGRVDFALLSFRHPRRLTARWFWCGCLLALGAMFKGQILFVAPFFFFWPLWQRRWARTGRVLAGFRARLLRSSFRPGCLRIRSLGVAGDRGHLVAGFFSLAPGSRNVGLDGGLAAVAAFCFGGCGRRQLRLAAKSAFSTGASIIPISSSARATTCPRSWPICDWSLKEPYWTAHLGSLDLAFNWQWTLRLLYLGALVLCSLGAARHERRRDPRVLIALATPWLLMFALLGQMHERYLLWGAVLSAVALGVSLP